MELSLLKEALRGRTISLQQPVSGFTSLRDQRCRELWPRLIPDHVYFATILYCSTSKVIAPSSMA